MSEKYEANCLRCFLAEDRVSVGLNT